MNNPYRARPLRSRTSDHATGYTTHNQTMWNPMPSTQQVQVLSNDTLQHQSSIVNQANQPNDWDLSWNNEWNGAEWSSEKSEMHQQQQQHHLQLQHQHQQHRQQQHYIPTYSNRGQLISTPAQDRYYQHHNGNNNNDVPSQHHLSGRVTPKTNTVKQPVSSHLDFFGSFSNYNQNQQYTIPPQPNSSFFKIADAEDSKLDSDREWNNILTNELSTGMYQLSVSNKQKNNQENQNQSKEFHSTEHLDGHSQQMITGCGVNNVQNNSKPDNILIPTSDYTKSMESSQPIDGQPIPIQEHTASNTYQINTNKIHENTSQNMYDQWYNNNTIPPPIENSLFSKDNIRGSKQWPEQSVENYENIQQPSEFVNLEVITPAMEEHDIYGSRESINKETLDNDPKAVVSTPKETSNVREYRQEGSNVEISSVQQHTQNHRSLQQEQTPDNYEFASNDRNTFLETGELTDSHPDHELSPPNQDDENDEVPNDIPFLREVPGQSSSIDPRRNDPTGQEQYIQSAQRLSDPRRNDPSGQEQGLQIRNISDRSERRDVPPGQERSISSLSRSDSDTLERRNDPSGREHSLPPQQSRNDPSGEERYQVQSQIMLESCEIREIPGRGNELEEVTQQTDGGLRQIPRGASPNETIQPLDDRSIGRVVTGSQEVPLPIPSTSDQASDSRNKREEAVGASEGGNQISQVPSVRKDSYENEDDNTSSNSREGSRERRRDTSPDRRRYDYDRKSTYYERDREYDDDYYYERRRAVDNERSYGDFERRDLSYRDEDRKHSRDDLDRHPRDEIERRSRTKDEPDERDGRRRPEDRRRDRGDDPRRRDRGEPREYDLRYSRDRDYLDRDRRRDDRRTRRYDDYDIRDPYRREYYEDPYTRSSRPSSRSSYNDRDREYYMRSRDSYYAYNGYGGYDYNAPYGNNYYAYLENLRRTNPAAYTEWYHKYYASQHPQQHVPRGVSNYPEDRASVHSGRSSCEERTTGDKRTLAEMSLLEDSTTSARLTPTKFSTCHIYGCFSVGSLIHVPPSYPADGERAKVDILRVDNLLLHDPVSRDLRAYPGPLIKQVGVTHKKTIIDYCENKIKRATANDDMFDRASYILLYELMIMLIQQNGNVVGVDIATLLLRNKDAYPYDTNKHKLQDIGRRESIMSQRSGMSANGNNQDITISTDKLENAKQQKTIEQITDEFRNTLLYGLVQEALEYAMTEGLWGHALFLASKLDKRTHASVMTRFANSLLPSDPLQTLYQLHSGRIPAIVTCVADPRWDDWRPHLAMIISNTSTNPEINRRSVTTLGDTLFARGDIYAAHFCYILAQVDFSGYGTSVAKLVLIGSNHHKSYSEFMTTEAVMLTEIYEYARNLSEPGFTLVDLQTFKFDLAVKMVDCGLMEKGLLYIEQIAVNIVNEPSKYKKSFIMSVYDLGDKIKYHDPIFKDSIEDATNLTWLNNLAEIVNKYQMGELVEGRAYESQSNSDLQSTLQSQETHDMKLQSQQQQQWGNTQAEYREGPTSMMDVTGPDMQSDWQPLSLPTNIQDGYNQSTQCTHSDESNQYQQAQQQDYWNQQTYYQNNFGRNDGTPSNWQQQPPHPQYADAQLDTDNSQQQEKWNYEAEREEKTSTPEVSNYMLTLDNNLNSEWPLDGKNNSTLRRRKVPSTLDFGSSSQMPIINDISQFSSITVSCVRDLVNSEVKEKKLPKFKKYPKTSIAYPTILHSDKIYSKNIRKIKKVDPRYNKPPCSQPPVFLKCKIKKKILDGKNEETSNESNMIYSQKTDFDIQFDTAQFNSSDELSEVFIENVNINKNKKSNKCQTLKQYYTFEEKNVVRRAPHIRRKDVIRDTVDAWSYSNNEDQSQYKPLIFKGTYPIDVPISFENNNYPFTSTNSVEKYISKNYDIDAPIYCE